MHAAFKYTGNDSTSSEKKGPCPVCGGEDRFHYNNSNGVVRWHCRHCGPGNTILNRRVFEIVRGITNGFHETQSVQPSKKKVTPSKQPLYPSRTEHLVGLLWKLSTPINICTRAEITTPGLAYLRNRCVFPPVGVPYQYPKNVRWIPARAFNATVGQLVTKPTKQAAGCILYFMHNPRHEKLAVMVETLSDSGERLTERYRKTLGTASICVFKAYCGLDGVRKPSTVHICEGPIDALALANMLPNEAILAVGSNAYSHTQPFLDNLPDPKPLAVTIHADAGTAGSNAAYKFAQDLAQNLSAYQPVVNYYENDDPGATWQKRIQDGLKGFSSNNLDVATAQVWTAMLGDTVQ